MSKFQFMPDTNFEGKRVAHIVLAKPESEAVKFSREEVDAAVEDMRANSSNISSIERGGVCIGRTDASSCPDFALVARSKDGLFLNKLTVDDDGMIEYEGIPFFSESVRAQAGEKLPRMCAKAEIYTERVLNGRSVENAMRFLDDAAEILAG